VKGKKGKLSHQKSQTPDEKIRLARFKRESDRVSNRVFQQNWLGAAVRVFQPNDRSDQYRSLDHSRVG